MKPTSGQTSTPNNDTSSTSVDASTEAQAEAAAAPRASVPKNEPAFHKPAEDHSVPRDEHDGQGGAFVMREGKRLKVQARSEGEGNKKKVTYFIEVDGRKIPTDENGSPL